MAATIEQLEKYRSDLIEWTEDLIKHLEEEANSNWIPKGMCAVTLESTMPSNNDLHDIDKHKRCVEFYKDIQFTTSPKGVVTLLMSGYKFFDKVWFDRAQNIMIMAEFTKI